MDNDAKHLIKIAVIRKCLKGVLSSATAAKELNCSQRTIKRYKRRFLAFGSQGLVDRRGGNNHRLITKLLKIPDIFIILILLNQKKQRLPSE